MFWTLTLYGTAKITEAVLKFPLPVRPWID
jgi:hypothetical protein